MAVMEDLSVNFTDFEWLAKSIRAIYIYNSLLTDISDDEALRSQNVREGHHQKACDKKCHQKINWRQDKSSTLEAGDTAKQNKIFMSSAQFDTIWCSKEIHEKIPHLIYIVFGTV